MSFTKFKTVAALAANIFGAANAHLIMQNPVPFGASSLDNSPLVDAAIGSSGSNYPCKQRVGVYDITSMNNMKVGDTQLLDFKGSASHGGGTCELVYTTDLEPTANTTFKLFQTYQGNCPTSSDGNGGTTPFTFTLPEGTPNGRMTLAWIWYNYEGNREIYMNCAPLDVTGGSDNQDFYNSLPNAYIINLPSSSCSTPENAAVVIPNPGQYILTADQKSATASGSACAASAAAQTSGVSGYKTDVITSGAAYKAPANNMDSTVAASGSAAATGSSGAASSAAVDNGQYTGEGAATTAAAVQTSAAPAAPATSAAQTTAAASTSVASSFVTVSTATVAADSSSSPAAQASSYVSAGASALGNSTTASGNTTCSGDGTVVCSSDGTMFGLCDKGNAVMQAVAAGTTCSNGSITKRGAPKHPHARVQI